MLNSAYLEETLVEILNDLVSARLAQRQFRMNRAHPLVTLNPSGLTDNRIHSASILISR